LCPDSCAARAYDCLSIKENYYCNFALNPSYQQALAADGLLISGWDAQNEARIVELPSHPFYVGTLFVPQSRSAIGNPHPLISAFIAAAKQL
jgi:CTP synthase (UTP-ammonia lyase)